MRFISKYGRFGVQIQPIRAHALAEGGMHISQEPVYAFFHPYKLTPLEREMALAHWTFNGFYQELDEVSIVPPDYRIGHVESDEAALENGWDPDMKRRVEVELERLAEAFTDILVVRSTIPPPWPRYDEFRGTPQALVRRLIEDGHDLDAVFTYERDHQSRPKVLEEITKAIESGGVEVNAEEEVLG
jgi:hypothetical protein